MGDFAARMAASRARVAALRGGAAAEAPATDRSNPKIAVLTSLDRLQYEQQREAAAAELGIRVSALDKLVRQAQAAVENQNTALPHWNVEPWPEPVIGAELLDAIKQVFRRYIVLPKDADIALALWVLHAWTMDAGDISPFMVLVSPTKRCGKTSVLILLYFLTPKSELAANITASSLFRYIEAVRPTLLIDEADSFVKDNEELRGVLNSGHTKVAANVIRNVEVNGEHKPRRFSTWAPKAIATIRALADTLEDRSIIITLQRKPREADVKRLRRRDTEELKTIRSQAARWAADNFDRLGDPEPVVPEVLNDRAADNWRPLLAIADLAGGAWPEDARRTACLLSGEEQDGAVNVELLRDIRIAFGDDEVIRSSDLVDKLAADLERPWADWKHGRALSQKQLGGLLRPFCITSETINFGGGQYAKGYRRVHFDEAWAAYCPGQNALPAQSGPSEASFRHNADEIGTTSDFRSVTESRGDGSKTGKLSYSHAGCDGITDRRAQNSGQGNFDQGRETAATSDDGLDLPDSLRRPPSDATCAECRRGDEDGVLKPDRANGRLEWLHQKCLGYRRGKAAMARNRRPLTAPGRSAPRATTSPDSGDVARKQASGR